MNVNWIRTFVTAAKYENFYQTSEALYLSQPTVTVHIKQLEKELGVPLFIRKGRNVALSSYGREFLQHAHAMMETLDDGVTHIERMRQGYNKTLTIAVSPLIASTYLPYWIKKFMKLHREVEVIVRVMESTFISEEVAQGLADLGLSRMESRVLGLTCEKIYEEPVKIVAPHDGGDLESSPPIELDDMIYREVLLTHNHPEYWDTLLIELKSLYRTMRTMKVSQVHVTKRFIEEGIGFSILPRSTVKRELAEGRLLEVEEKNLSLPKAATYVMSKHESEETSDFINNVKELL
ncbi:LysR family transcriptional regulator [Evansella halocellulosilytica]|uniref:LysR family transcriptional regulator n=1 Tax=Evansella halocellulosilytica TaxID=2011013 RepID=UPI000BB9A685|nr:LysR family transcriptional regulator [Evansella halocellulosilytica]